MNESIFYKEVTRKLHLRASLDLDEAERVLEEILKGQWSPVQVAALLAALATKGETASEIAGFARGMRRQAVRLDHQVDGVIDIVGTGGDGGKTFNISTTAAFVVAGAGVPVAKHGNRAISSSCGSADVLAQLGVNISAPPEVLRKCLEQCGITFLFAPQFHPAMKAVAPLRKELGFRTIFNLLGPLLNPAGVRRLVVGVFSPQWTEIFAEVLKLLGAEQAFIFSAEEGLDEITPSGRTRITELKEGGCRSYSADPEDYGVHRCPLESLRGGDVEENSRILRQILDLRLTGPKQDAVLLNAAAGIYVSGRATDQDEGMAMARASLLSGKALQKLESLIQCSNGA